jgi:hypothetical protein
VAGKDEIQKAISAHGMWKARLLTAVNTGSSDFTVAQVSSDQNCDFGKWLYNGIDGTTRSSPHYEEVRRLHAGFHSAAGKVLGSALGGNAPAAKASIEDQKGEYATASSTLTKALMGWMNDF